jgi:hypothetical protein
VLEFLARTIRQEKVIREIQIGNEDMKLSLFANDMIWHLKDPKDSTKRLYQKTLRYDKHFLTGYKVNVQKSIAFPHTNNE